MKKICVLLLLAYTAHTLYGQPQQAPQENAKPEKWITVLIHGSFSLRPHLNFTNIFKMLADTIEESIYYRSTEINRRDPFFYKNQAMAGLGLYKIDINHPHNNAAAPILAASFETVALHCAYPATEEYYTFGWSGLVSNKLRYLEASFLYKDLYRLHKKFEQQGFTPKIRLVGYSHGGNLALQLGAIYGTKSKDQQFIIDELWLLGTPIQVETDYLVNSPIFVKVFNFYSRSDRVQTLDFFSLKRFFSNKKFSKRHNFKIPKKLYQIRLKVSEYIPTKKAPDFQGKVPSNADLKKYFKEFNYDPGHFELWFMGWTILTYRNEFPFYPLPLLTFLPFIVRHIESTPDIPNDLVAHFKTNFNVVDFMPYHTVKSKYFAQVPFIDIELIKHMQNNVKQFVPDDYNIEIYNQKVYGAINIAEHEEREINRLLKLEKKKQAVLPQKNNLHKHDIAYRGHLQAA